MTGRPPPCDPAEFVRAWQAADSTDEVADSMDLGSARVAYQFARYLRGKGVPLKRLVAARTGPTDYAALAKIAATCSGAKKVGAHIPMAFDDAGRLLPKYIERGEA